MIVIINEYMICTRLSCFSSSEPSDHLLVLGKSTKNPKSSLRKPTLQKPTAFRCLLRKEDLQILNPNIQKYQALSGSIDEAEH
jgi:hypothetical protein